MSASSPLVSVVMPVYNSERYLKEAIESILHQTFQDFEFLIIEDKSIDSTEFILHRYQQIDSRINVYSQERKGLIASLNKGCSLARGKYIARMDADDISFPHRLERQVNYMEEHPEIGILGTGIRYINEIGRMGKSVRVITDPKMIRFHLYFANCIAHPSVMMRREVVKCLDFYNVDAIHAEDYDLWIRAASISQVANLAEILLKYRIWRGRISSNNYLLRNQTEVRIRQSFIKKLIGHEIAPDLVITPSFASHAPLHAMPSLFNKMIQLMLTVYRAYIATTPLSWRESLSAKYVLVIILKNIVKEILNVKTSPIRI